MGSESGVPKSPGERRISVVQLTWAALAGLVAAHVILAILLFDPKPFVGGDNAGYMILAESLQTGQGYRNIHLPAAPLHSQYPPFYPIILAFVQALGGGLMAFKVLSVLFTTATVVAVFMLGRVRLGWQVGLAIAAPFALNPVLLYYSHWVLSEAPFVLLTLLALWASERMTESNRFFAITLIAGLLAFLTRSAGLPLLVALLLALGWRGLWRQLAVAGGATLAVVVGWWVWGRIAATAGEQVYTGNFLAVNPYDPSLGIIGPGDLLARTVENVRLYSIQVLPESLAGAEAGGMNLLALLAALLIIALALVAWVRDIRKVRVVELFAVLYAALIILWPEVWTDRRFLLPLLPVLLFLAAAGVVWCFQFIRAKRPVWLLPALGLLLVLLAIPGHVRSVRYSRHCMSVYQQGDPLACYPTPWRAFVEAANWVRANTPDDVIVVNRKPRLFYYFSKRRGEVYPFTSDDDAMLAFLDRIAADYVVVAAISGTTFRYLVPVIRSVPDHFELVHVVGDPSAPDAWVLSYRKSAAAAIDPEEAR